MKKLLALGTLAFALSACGASQSDVCRQYLECQKILLEKTSSSSTYDLLETQYGPEGTCWNDPANASICDASCEAALKSAKGNGVEACQL